MPTTVPKPRDFSKADFGPVRPPSPLENAVVFKDVLAPSSLFPQGHRSKTVTVCTRSPFCSVGA